MYVLASLVLGLFVGGVQAEPIDADLSAKVDTALKSLEAWAADPEVINAVKAANSKGPGEMTNATWTTMADSDAAVKAITGNALSDKLRGWEKQGILNKLFVRDQKANLVAGSNKALLFNNASRPQFKDAVSGNAFRAKEAKPDPTTQILSVQVAVPIKDGATVIGVMNAAVSAK
jgi:hypothetical protein